jgi:quercetin dioxygenase-like cupin family protein
MDDTNRRITSNDVIVRRAGHNTIGALGAQVSVLARGADTGDSWSLLEYVSPAGGAAPPPHWHKVARESFYVLEGTLQFQLDERTVEAPTGTLVVVPPRTVHAWRNTGPTAARFLVMFSPAGFEDYFQELFAWVNSEPSWPPQDMGRMAALNAKYDTFAPPVV